MTFQLFVIIVQKLKNGSITFCSANSAKVCQYLKLAVLQERYESITSWYFDMVLEPELQPIVSFNHMESCSVNLSYDLDNASSILRIYSHSFLVVA